MKILTRNPKFSLTRGKSDRLLGEKPSLETLLLAMAVGDSLGFPGEGLSGRRLEKLGWTDWRQRFWKGQGVTSDDTDHAILTVSSLISSSGEGQKFGEELGKRLVRWWFTFPPGVGGATWRACVRLILRVPASRSGVRSAGNGPAMRSPVLGAVFCEDPVRLREFVEVSTRVTHTDPRAITGALAVAQCVAWGFRGDEVEREGVLKMLREAGRASDREWEELMDRMEQSLEKEDSVAGYARSIGAVDGVSGYMYRTVPVAIYSWLRHPASFEKSLSEVLSLGGDTDTAGAIHAAIASVGLKEEENEIPEQWMKIWRYPTGETSGYTLDDIVHEALTTSTCTFYFRDPWFSGWMNNIAVFWMVMWHCVFVRRLPSSLARRVIR